jgi:hypothetical protein
VHSADVAFDVNASAGGRCVYTLPLSTLPLITLSLSTLPFITLPLSTLSFITLPFSKLPYYSSLPCIRTVFRALVLLCVRLAQSKTMFKLTRFRVFDIEVFVQKPISRAGIIYFWLGWCRWVGELWVVSVTESLTLNWFFRRQTEVRSGGNFFKHFRFLLCGNCGFCFISTAARALSPRASGTGSFARTPIGKHRFLNFLWL